MRPDIYDGDEVDRLKRENADLRERIADLVRENTQLSSRLDYQRRMRAFEADTEVHNL